jgi:ABC-type transport system involved in cytochrome c biogenesis permease subunit
MNMDQSDDRGKALIGRVLCAVALLFCVPVGVLFVSVATGAVGIVLGVVGYLLGARGLARLAVVLCTAAMFLGLLVGQGAIPGSYDALLYGIEETLQDPLEGGDQP